MFNRLREVPILIITSCYGRPIDLKREVRPKQLALDQGWESLHGTGTVHVLSAWLGQLVLAIYDLDAPRRILVMKLIYAMSSSNHPHACEWLKWAPQAKPYHLYLS